MQFFIIPILVTTRQTLQAIRHPSCVISESQLACGTLIKTEVLVFILLSNSLGHKILFCVLVVCLLL